MERNKIPLAVLKVSVMRQDPLSFFLHNHLKKYPNRRLAQLLNENNYGCEILEQMVFKKVKLKAMVALRHLVQESWPFVVVDKVLSPYAVLKYQSQGVRPVSMIHQEVLAPILNREDCLEFFLHDLEHGYMFFYDEELKSSQIQFFQSVLRSLETDLWRPYLSDANFQQRFNYLISDMNSHKEHYRHYLKSMVPPEDFPRFEFLFS